MAELLIATGVPLGLVTNGERWVLVFAERQQPTGTAEWRAELWFEERLTIRAFRDLLGVESFFNRKPTQTLAALYRRSLENQQEVSTTLGRQVRRAVELFVAALDRADREAHRALLKDVPEERIYEASLSLMMRLVFLLFAEERDLLPLSNPVYNSYYAVSTMHQQLRDDADAHGEEILERREDGFRRLLAVFRAVHGGTTHDQFALPAYGGHLFDPDRFPFLEGRAADTTWRDAEAQPIPIHNRTVLHLLEALQFLEMKVPGGGTEKRRVSFRALDIEQIGHVYEGLLDHTAKRATEPILGLAGPEEPEIALAEIEIRKDSPDFIAWLKEQTGRSAPSLEKALKQNIAVDTARWPLWDRVKPFAALVRLDDNRDPSVIPSGSVYVTAGTARRQSGTQYTPRSLTREVVKYALEPICYEGPAEGNPATEWKLKDAGELLSLKICDPACGSGAFLAEACRYLADRLVEAWDAAEQRLGPGVKITPYGDASVGLPDEALLPADKDERALIARRLVAQRCLYGVDKNPLAAEMAKLSLWLLTLEKDKPFTFLDHAIRSGDSLLGVNLQQLKFYNLSGSGKEATHLMFLQDDLMYASERRDGLSKLQYRPEDQERMLKDALARTRRARAAADLLLATAFEDNPENLAQQVAMGLDQQEVAARSVLLDMRPFHWPVEFPEVFTRSDGFDAIIGNPPFMGGQRITGALGKPYRDYLVERLARGQRGSADYVAYFFLRADELLKPHGTAGLLATNTIAQGDTREVGLDQLTAHGATIYRAVASRKWPGDASLEVAWVWWRKGEWGGEAVLEETPVAGISSQLIVPGATVGRPFRLIANAARSFQGSIVLGLGFVLEPEHAEQLLNKDQRNRDVLFPYLNGDDFNSRWDQSPSRWVINFHDWPIDRAREYPDCFEIIERLVKPERIRNKYSAHARENWWQYERPRPELYEKIAGLSRVLVRSQVSKTQAGSFVSNQIVYDQRLVVFATDCSGQFALLDSSIHYFWALANGSTLRTDATYTPTQCFETFPFPDDVTRLKETGDHYFSLRLKIASDLREGLTAIYNRFHRRTEAARDIRQLRALHVEMDHAVTTAYGWSDLDLGHDFHETKQGIRFTISEEARRKVLDRLLVLNHARHALELAAAPETKLKRARMKKVAIENTLLQNTLF
ncbi:MAG: DNA methyltransferase [Bryobacteraceae bacterium]